MSAQTEGQNPGSMLPPKDLKPPKTVGQPSEETPYPYSSIDPGFIVPHKGVGEIDKGFKISVGDPKASDPGFAVKPPNPDMTPDLDSLHRGASRIKPSENQGDVQNPPNKP